MSVEEIDKIVAWANINCWYDDRAEEMAISPRELEEFLETLITNKNK